MTPKSNRYLHLKVGETSFPCGELQKCHETERAMQALLPQQNSTKSRDLQFFAAPTSRGCKQTAALCYASIKQRLEVENARVALFLRAIIERKI
jgi:hypothetical protein